MDRQEFVGLVGRAVERLPPEFQSKLENVDIVGAEIWEFGFKAEYRGEETNDNISIVGGTPEYPQNNTHFIGYGRNISQMDVRAARRVAVIGHAIAQRLYPFVDPVGRDRPSGSQGQG